MVVASSGMGVGGGLVSVNATTMIRECCNSNKNRVKMLKNEEGEEAM